MNPGHGPTGLPCPSCGDFTGVVDSRPTRLGDVPAIRRRRRCTSCDHRFSSYELHSDVIAAVDRVLTETFERPDHAKTPG